MNMIGVTIDTFPTYRQLKNAGFTEVQAEALVESFRTLNEELAKNLVNKDEFNVAVMELKEQIKNLEIRMISSEERLNNKIDMLAKDLTIKIGYMLAASVGLIVALTKLV